MPTQSTDISGNPAIAYTANGQKWKILKKVDVDSATYGVYSVYTDSVLQNKGSVHGNSVAVYFQGSGVASDYVIVNQKSGELEGEYGIAITTFLGSASIVNKGSVDGSSYGAVVQGQATVKVDNSGELEGGQYGLVVTASKFNLDNTGDIESSSYGVIFQAAASGDDAKIKNGGKIEGGLYALIMQTDGDVKINNLKGGVIEGDQVSIYSVGETIIKNAGKIEGIIITSNFEDKVVNKKKIDGDVILSGGDDVFKNKDKGKVDGAIAGGDGNDKIVLGAKAEEILFDTALNAATNVDRVKHFTSGKDVLLLDDDIFSTLMPGDLPASAFVKGTAAVDADDRIIYDKKTGSLYYDADGSGAGAQVKFAQLDKNTKLKASDFDVGDFIVI